MAEGFKQRIFSEFARIGSALASEKRLELLDLLAQGPRHVEALASETGMSLANVSQHLQIMRRSRLVEVTREGTKTHYRLADDQVLHLWLALQGVAASRLAEVGQIEREFGVGQSEEDMPRAELQKLAKQGKVYLIDVRPPLEYQYGHLPGAVSMPLDELPKRLRNLPRDRPIVTYCRGAYCLMADEAVGLLRKHGFDARRLEGGWPEWRAEGRSVASG